MSAACQRAGDEVFVTSRDCSRVSWPADWAGQVTLLGADVLVPSSLSSAIEQARPERVFLLAGFAHVSGAEAAAEEALMINSIGTQRALYAIKRLAPSARVLYAGSSYEYGPVPRDRQPIREEEPVDPRSTYGVSRVSGSIVARRFALGEGLFVVRTRSFNHAGRRQKLEFAAPSFADQLLRGRLRGERVVAIKTGDLNVVRDFSGVEAAATAYRALIEEGRSGEVYNVCAGEPLRLGDLLERIAAVVGVEAAPERDQARLRVSESLQVVGDPRKLERVTGVTLRGSLEAAIKGLVRERENALTMSAS